MNVGLFSDDQGLLLENLVHSELLRRGHEIYWFKLKGECDFIVPEQGKIAAIQVCYELTPDNRDREIGGLVEAMDHCGGQGVIITFRQFDQISLSGKIMRVIPFWRWSLHLT